MSTGADKLDVVVADVTPVTDLVTRFTFAPRRGLLPPFSGGAHIVVELRDGPTPRLNPYSLMSSPRDTSHYAISVRRDDAGRGGSRFLHRAVRPGYAMVVSTPVNLFSLDLRATRHLMLAGGIGITPFLAQTAQLAADGGVFDLHYAARSRTHAAYADDLAARYGRSFTLYCDDRGQAIPLAPLLTGQPLGTHLYVCGPAGMIAWVRDTARALGWPDACVHYEHFAAPQPGAPFDVTLARSGRTLHVPGHQSLLEAIEAADVDPPYLCRGGVCGQCETAVLRHDGQILHADHWLDPADRASGAKIMPCVSRFTGTTLILDR